MTRSEIPDQWHDLITGYVLGNLTPAEQAQLQLLLQKHPELQEEVLAYEMTLAQIPQALPVQIPPPELENRILQNLHAQRTIDLQPASRRPLAPDRRYWWGLGTAIAAGLVLAMGWDNYQLRRSLNASRQDLTLANQVIQQLQQNQQQTEAVLTSLRIPNKAVYSLQGIGDLASASGSVVTLMEENRAILIPHNLPTLPPEQIYRFWAAIETETSESSIVYCGQFNTNDNDTVQWALPEPDCGTHARQVLITVDPVTASTESGGELVMQSPPSQGS